MSTTSLSAMVHGIVAIVILLVTDAYVDETSRRQPMDPLILFPVVAGAVVVGGLLGRHLRRPVDELIRTVQRHDVADSQQWPAMCTVAAPELNQLNWALRELQERNRSTIESLADEANRHHEVFNSISEALLVTDERGRILLTNRALDELFDIDSTTSVSGWQPVEAIRLTVLTDAITEVLTTHQTVADRDVLLRGTTTRHLDMHVAPILDDGQLVGTVTVFHEITRLRRLERIRADFVANVSHELRTPLTAIKGCAETLADGALDDVDAARRFVDVIGTHADRLSVLLNDLLDLSRLEAEELQLEIQPHSLGRIIDTAQEAVRKTSADKEIQIEIEMEDPEVRVLCDRQLIEQAMINLVDNAVKYTSSGGRVTIRSRQVSRQQAMIDLAEHQFSAGGVEDVVDADKHGARRVMIVEVNDSGIGIPSDMLDRIFERFYRVDKGRSREMGGTGLGLSIVRHSIALHGERVFVDSELGVGSTFGFTLAVA